MGMMFSRRRLKKRKKALQAAKGETPAATVQPEIEQPKRQRKPRSNKVA